MAYKKIKIIIYPLLTLSVLGLVGCGKDNKENNKGVVTYRTYTAVMPGNWNELTYTDNNDKQIMDYIVSPFFEYDFAFDDAKGGKFKKDGSINKEAIIDGDYKVNYSAATKLEDVTKEVEDKWGYTKEQKELGGYAWKITLRDDLKWEDGSKIKGKDFVYSMKQQLDPAFFNLRASTFYNNTPIKNARNYLYSNEDYIYVGVESEGYKSNSEALKKEGNLYINLIELINAENSIYVEKYSLQDNDLYLDYNKVYTKKWIEINNKDTYFNINLLKKTKPEYIKSDGKIDIEKIKKDKFNFEEYLFNANKVYLDNLKDSLEVGKDKANLIGIKKVNPDKNISFAKVGIYSPKENEIVICLDKPIKCLKEDGSLSYLAAYNLSSLPLVKEDIYEKCKIAPVAGSTLWTSKYNSSKETTASWGAYKLTQYQSGKSYTVEKNKNWYGYNMDDYKGQYNVDKITCEKISETETQWMGFLNGSLDNVSLDISHKDDYRGSKYTNFSPDTGTFGINLYSNLDVLKQNGRNNGILAILDFRKALSLSIDRDAYNSACYTSHKSCYGILGPSYYYDIENGGVYRDTKYAKEGLLRVYGFKEIEDGKWQSGDKVFENYEKAYDAMNGYNPTYAKELINNAYKELTKNPKKYGYNPNKKIKLIYGISSDNANTRRNYEFIKKIIEDMVEDTPLENKIEMEFNSSYGSKWADSFRNGEYDIAAGTGFKGGAFDPAGFLQCYIDPEAGLMYSTWWNTKQEKMTYKMPKGDYTESEKEFTMSLYNWYGCLNGIAENRDMEYKFNWGDGSIPQEARLQLLAKIEEKILETYYTIVTTSQYDASLLGKKFSYIVDEYNVFMGFGGTRYLIPEYDDYQWGNYVKSQGGNLEKEYKKSE